MSAAALSTLLGREPGCTCAEWPWQRKSTRSTCQEENAYETRDRGFGLLPSSCAVIVAQRLDEGLGDGPIMNR